MVEVRRVQDVPARVLRSLGRERGAVSPPARDLASRAVDGVLLSAEGAALQRAAAGTSETRPALVPLGEWQAGDDGLEADVRARFDGPFQRLHLTLRLFDQPATSGQGLRRGRREAMLVQVTVVGVAPAAQLAEQRAGTELDVAAAVLEVARKLATVARTPGRKRVVIIFDDERAAAAVSGAQHGEWLQAIFHLASLAMSTSGLRRIHEPPRATGEPEPPPQSVAIHIRSEDGNGFAVAAEPPTHDLGVA